ncbi:MAG TPA: glycosyltransferase [Micromonosporaceae bacterium]|nr:glycosyltransferase [Micromonosporaceae bacterium]
MINASEARTLDRSSPVLLTDADPKPRGRRPRLAMVSTYSPRRCGIATFSEDLRTALGEVAPDLAVSICAVERDALAHPDEVETVIRTDSPDDYRIAARRMAALGVDAVLIQHEYGIFGGDDGEYVLILAGELRRLGVPYLVTLHTVLSRPSAGQAATLRALCEGAQTVTVFSPTAVRLLERNDLVPADRVVVVPHGAPEILYSPPRSVRSAALAAVLAEARRRPLVSTFGLIGPGKGIEAAIDALAAVARRHPDVLYVVAGATHPEQVRQHGERYRHSLLERVTELGLEENIRFVDDFLTEADLAALLGRTAVYLTPYPNREQISSGTLTFAVAAGCAIVSTDYHYARDLVSAEMGAVVPVEDPYAIATALNRLFGDGTLLSRARAASSRLGERLSWPAVAGRVLSHVTPLAPAGALAHR